MSDVSLTQKVKSFAFGEGVSLVGIAPVSRWEKAPVQHSPAGIFPEAKSVIVCALHIPDACVELGAEDDVRESGLGFVQGNVTLTLNHVALRVARFMEDNGWKAVPVAATVLWNYRAQPGAERGWMSDMCHYYAAACAGLGEIGWNNLCITPQYGTRQRFISIITDAELEPDPLYSGEPLCDKCFLCVKNCPTKSFEKELCGNCVIEIEDKKYTFPRRNLWRCALGENFQLDVLREWPGKIDEKVIVDAAEEAVRKHPEWIFGWKMGQCLKWCVNPGRRYFDRKYCKSPRRKRDMSTDISPEAVASATREAMALAFEKGADYFATVSLEDMKKKGIDLAKELPDAKGAVILGFYSMEEVALTPVLWANSLLVTNLLEKYGYSTITRSTISPGDAALACGAINSGEEPGEPNGLKRVFELVITACPVMTDVKPFNNIKAVPHEKTPEELSAMVKKSLCPSGLDLSGIADADLFDDMISRANSLSESSRSEYFTVKDETVQIRKGVWGYQAMPFNPKVSEGGKALKKASDFLPGAKSMVVGGMKLLDGVVENVGKGEGRKAGHYQYSVHETGVAELMKMLSQTAKLICSMGYRVALIPLSNTDSHFLTANRFAAVAAGLGEIGWNGQVLTPQYGPRQIFASLVTDAPLAFDSLYDGPQLCQECHSCVKACPSQAISKEDSVSISVKGKTFSWGKNDRLRCDWACKYGFMREAGPGYIGSQTDFPVPDKITPEAVCKAMENSDRLQRPYYKTIVEKCFVECPAGKKK